MSYPMGPTDPGEGSSWPAAWQGGPLRAGAPPAPSGDEPYLIDPADDEPPESWWKRTALTAAVGGGCALLLAGIVATVALAGSPESARGTNKALVVDTLGTTTTTSAPAAGSPGAAASVSTSTAPMLTLPPAPADDAPENVVVVYNVAVASAQASSSVGVGVGIFLEVPPGAGDGATEAPATPAGSAAPATTVAAPEATVAETTTSSLPAPTTTADLGILVQPPVADGAAGETTAPPTGTAPAGPADADASIEPATTSAGLPTLPPPAPSAVPVDPAPTSPPLGETTATTGAPVEATPSLLEALDAEPQASVFLSVVRASDAGEVLDGPGPLTIFVPTDAAMDALGITEQLLADPVTASSFVRAHIVEGTIDGAALEEGGTAVTLTGDVLQLAPGSVSGFPVTTADIRVSNAVVHLVDGVPVPAPTPDG